MNRLELFLKERADIERIETHKGCSAYIKTFSNGAYQVITDLEGYQAPENLDQPVTVTSYDKDGKHQQEIDYESFIEYLKGKEYQEMKQTEEYQWIKNILFRPEEVLSDPIELGESFKQSIARIIHGNLEQ